MHIISTKDPDPRLSQAVNGDDNGQYTFGLSDEDIAMYTRLGDLFHALICFRNGPSKLTPCMIKRIDIVPILLRGLPWHDLM